MVASSDAGGIFSNGVCAPSTCTEEEVAGIYGNIRQHYPFLVAKNKAHWHPAGYAWSQDMRDHQEEYDNADWAFV